MISELIKKNEELAAQLRRLQTEREALRTELARSEAEKKLLHLRIAQLRHLLYGRRSEKHPPVEDNGIRQTELFQEAVKEIRAEEAEEKETDATAEDPEYVEVVIAAIQKLYRIEREAKDSGIEGENLVELRCQEARPILEIIKELFEAKRRAVLPQSGIGMAISYGLEQWDSLVRYVDVAEAEIDNNGAEQSLRGVVIGRKNWLFIGHPDAGPRAATILSLIETCRRLGIEPYEYLKDVLTELPKDPSRAESLTPRAWLSTRKASASENSQEAPAQ